MLLIGGGGAENEGGGGGVWMRALVCDLEVFSRMGDGVKTEEQRAETKEGDEEDEEAGWLLYFGMIYCIADWFEGGGGRGRGKRRRKEERQDDEEEHEEGRR